MENVPRKEKAFINFAINSLKLRGDYGKQIAASIWSHLSLVRTEQAKMKNRQTDDNHVEEEKEEQEQEQTLLISSQKVQESKQQVEPKADHKHDSLRKNVDKIMKKILKKETPGHGLKFKQLRRKVKTKLRVKNIGYNKGDVKKTIMESSLVKIEGKDVILLL